MKTDCCCPPPTKPSACGCCEGVEPLTPLPTANRPGLPVLSYRIGTHAAFLETMKARLSGSEYAKLAELTTREADDPAIAWLDAWAIVADVLTFYQERIANEGYLRTATERRLVLELARLVGYQPRPGVASSVYLAYTLDDNFKEEVIIPKDAWSQSAPGPGELPQSFETSEGLKARTKWNNLRPRMTQPQTPDTIDLDREKAPDKRTYRPRVYFKGITTNLKANDPLLIDFSGTGNPPAFYRVQEVTPDPVADRTLVALQVHASEPPPPPVSQPIDLIGALTLPPSVQRPNSLRLERTLKTLFLGDGKEQDISGPSSASTAASVHPSVLLRNTLAGGEASHAALKAFAPVLRETLATAAANAEVTRPSEIKVYALRTKAALFGHNYLGIPVSFSPTRGLGALAELPTGGNAFVTLHIPVSLKQLWPADLVKPTAGGLATIALDPQNEQLQKGGWMVIERPELGAVSSRGPSSIHSQGSGRPTDHHVWPPRREFLYRLLFEG